MITKRKTARDCSAQLTLPFDPVQPCPAILTALLEQVEEAGAIVMGSYGESMQSSLTFTLYFAALNARYRRAPLVIRTMTIQPSIFLFSLNPAALRGR
jgi:hypothetical protein